MAKHYSLILIDELEEHAELFRQELDEEIDVRALHKIDAVFEYLHSGFKGILVVKASLFLKTNSDSILRLISRISALDLPLIYLFASDTIKMREDLLEKGGCDYLLEPLKPVEIRKKINLHFSRLELKEVLQEQHTPGTSNALQENKELRKTVEKLRENEKLLKELKLQAERMSQLKSTFIGTISHELRTPLNNILGISQLLIDDIEDAKHKGLIKKVDESGKRLMKTLNSILDLSLLESKEIQVHSDMVNLTARVQRVSAQFKAYALEKGLTLDFTAEDDVYVLSDERYLDQTVSNILDNAIKFTESGGISIAVTEELSDGIKRGVVTIADTGIGIDSDKYDLIFEEYRQASEGHSRLYEGSGLGLTIAKKMIEKLNGSIDVSSNEAGGSVFTIGFPSAKTADDDSTIRIHEKGKDAQKARVLLVEDNLVNVEITRAFLESICELDDAKTGIEALELAKKNKYDAVLMDINLGKGMNGMEVTRRLRNLPHYKSVPIIALTGYAMAGDREKFLKEGMTHYLAKPFLEEDLVSLVAGVLANHNFMGQVR